MIKLVHKPVSMPVSVLGGALAGAIFKKAWKITAGEDEAPQATDAWRGWREILLAAALQGAIFALVKAAPSPPCPPGGKSPPPPTPWLCQPGVAPVFFSDLASPGRP